MSPTVRGRASRPRDLARRAAHGARARGARAGGSRKAAAGAGPRRPATDSAEWAALPPGDVVRIAWSLWDPVLVCDAACRVRWANAAALAFGVAPPGCRVAESRDDARWLAPTWVRWPGQPAAPRLQLGRLALADGPALVTAWWSPAHVALLVRPPRGTSAELAETLVRRYGLSIAEARLALQLRAGAATDECAASAGLAAGTVRWRLHRVCAALGQASRTGLLAELDRIAAGLPAAAVASPSGEEPPSIEDDAGAALSDLLQHAEPALATVGADGRLAWANAGARAALGLVDAGAGVPAPTLAALERVAAALRGRSPGWVARLDAETRAALWSLRDGVRAARLYAPPLAAGPLAWRLGRCGALTAREAAVAARVGMGRPMAAVAADLGLAASTVRSLASRVAERLGVAGRAGLVEIVGRLRDAGPAPPWPTTWAPAEEGAGLDDHRRIADVSHTAKKSNE